MKVVKQGKSLFFFTEVAKWVLRIVFSYVCSAHYSVTNHFEKDLCNQSSYNGKILLQMYDILARKPQIFFISNIQYYCSV